MPDFPETSVLPQKTLVSNWGAQSLAAEAGLAQNLPPATGAVWPAANRALFTAIYIEHQCVAKRLAVVVTTQAGNLDLGIYDETGARIVAKGTTATAAAGTQILDITSGVTGTASPTLSPGTYFLGMGCSSGTAAFKSSTLTSAEMCRICGLQQASLASEVLTATPTFANPASAYWPVIALGTAAVM